MNDRPLLRIAVPNKGSLSEATHAMLTEAGYTQRSDSKDLERTLDLGFTGRDMLLDSGADAREVMALGFGGTRFRFAAPAGTPWQVADLEGKRIATSYPGLLGSWLAGRGITSRLIKLDGAVESAVRLGVADAIADVVETGSTLRRAGLEMFGEPIMVSEAILIQPSGATGPDGLDLLLRRLSGVMTARNYRMVEYNVPAERLDAACAITPGIDSPTVSHLARSGWLAVRAMIPAKEAPTIMDELWDAGAEGILVTDIAACRL